MAKKVNKNNEEDIYQDAPRLVWYDIELDEIFLSATLDAMFCCLVPINWERVELVGEL